MTKIRRLTKDDLPRLSQFWVEHWGGDEMVIHGDIFNVHQLDGFVAEEKNEWVGLITFYIKSDTCEITSLDSLQENKGIGTRLIQAVAGEAVKSKCKRVFLVTTNDNLRALGFYQKRGFRITAVHSSAIDEARKVKPAIPHIGLNGIPLRDEIDFELLIK